MNIAINVTPIKTTETIATIWAVEGLLRSTALIMAFNTKNKITVIAALISFMFLLKVIDRTFIRDSTHVISLS